MAESPTPIAEIDHGPSKLDQFLDQHTPKLIIAAILIALGVIAFVIYSGLAEAKNEEAGSALTVAESSSDYQDVISQWPETKSAESAMLLLAAAQDEESPEESIQTLRGFIDQYPEHPAVDTAKVSLGLKLIKQGNSSEAVPTLTEVAGNGSDSYISPLAAITLGDIAKAAGNAEEAKSWYEKASTNGDQGNSYADAAQNRILLASAKAPTKVKPAPPAPSIPKAPTPPVPSVPTPPAVTPTLPTTPAPPAIPAVPTPSVIEDKVVEQVAPNTPEKP